MDLVCARLHFRNMHTRRCFVKTLHLAFTQMLSGSMPLERGPQWTKTFGFDCAGGMVTVRTTVRLEDGRKGATVATTAISMVSSLVLSVSAHLQVGWTHWLLLCGSFLLRFFRVSERFVHYFICSADCLSHCFCCPLGCCIKRMQTRRQLYLHVPFTY